MQFLLQSEYRVKLESVALFVCLELVPKSEYCGWISVFIAASIVAKLYIRQI